MNCATRTRYAIAGLLELRRLEPLRLPFLAVDAESLEEAADHHVVADGQRELDQCARAQEYLDRLEGLVRRLDVAHDIVGEAQHRLLLVAEGRRLDGGVAQGSDL